MKQESHTQGMDAEYLTLGTVANMKHSELGKNQIGKQDMVMT